MINEFPKVTIMIPTYNQADYIAQTIESALAQDYPNLEVVVSDDRSTDTTEEVVKQYLNDSRVKYFKNSTNLGRVKNYRKTLYDYATGKYALNLDGDDWLIHNSYISKAVEILENNDDVVMVFARQKIYVENEKRFLESQSQEPHIPNIMEGNYLFLNTNKIYISHLSSLYNRNRAMDVGFYENDYISADLESITRIILGKKVAFVDELVGVWRMHSANESIQDDPVKLIKNLGAIDSCYDYALSKKVLDKRNLAQWKYETLYKMCFIFLYRQLKTGNIKIALNFVKLLGKYKPKIALALLFDLRPIITKLTHKFGGRFQKLHG